MGISYSSSHSPVSNKYGVFIASREVVDEFLSGQQDANEAAGASQSSLSKLSKPCYGSVMGICNLNDMTIVYQPVLARFKCTGEL